MSKRIVIITLCTALSIFLVGCGQKGDLYLPKPGQQDDVRVKTA